MVGRILPFDVSKQRGLLLQVHGVTVADSGGKYTRRLETGEVTELFASASEIAGRVFSHLEAPRPLGRGPAFRRTEPRPELRVLGNPIARAFHETPPIAAVQSLPHELALFV
eukprot:scaffold108153_cov59-Phaeocystis_antarctica.AAC.1